MKVLVATTNTQGEGFSDFFDAVDGELVVAFPPCDGLGPSHFGGCPCSIAFTGVASGEFTTTVMVVELDMGLTGFTKAVRDGLKRLGICSDCARYYGNQSRMRALEWPVGTVLQRFDDELSPRRFATL